MCPSTAPFQYKERKSKGSLRNGKWSKLRMFDGYRT